MRILFVGGGLEPGRDGVGDYIRRLAQECTRAGHTCALLGLNDPFIPAVTRRREEESDGIPVLRLSAQVPWAGRIAAAAKWRATFRPDWISVQFVPYAFNDRGFVPGLGGRLRRVVGDVPSHLMFHELWIGAFVGASVRQRLVGAIQRWAIRWLLFRLRPRLVTTTIPIYAALLAEIGCEAKILPLFGNVPIAAADPISASPAGNREEEWTGLFFGALHTEWQPEPLLGMLLRTAQKKGKRLRLVQAGRAGATGDQLWLRLEKKYGGAIIFDRRGAMSTAALSALFQAADFGIAASPWNLIGKSGSTTAMLEHGLPVIVTRDDYQVPGLRGIAPAPEPLLRQLNGNLERRLEADLERGALRARCPEIAARFSAWLHEAGSAAITAEKTAEPAA